MGKSFALGLYLAWSARGARRFAERRLATRLAEGKEDPERVDERRGEPSAPRPDGTLIWFHAASVGESVALLELIRRILEERADVSVLVTTGTVTSAGVMADRLPDRAIHQYIPLDARAFVNRFLDHWRPDLAIWCESEFWPALIAETHARGVPMMIVNARMSKTSHDRWRFLRGMMKSLLQRFDHALVQDDITAMYLRRLGMEPSRMEVAGTLKEGAAALPCNEEDRRRLAAGLAGRPVWLAASTHDGEERIVLDAHKLALKINPRLLLILAPRHPQRGDTIARMLQAESWRFTRRTDGEDPDAEAQVYLADTLGELGLWYRIAPISLVGGSLQPVGGHNPFEPAALGSAILHGPFVTNFVDIYRRLTAAGAARLVTGPDTLADAVHELLNPDRAASMAHAAWETVSQGAEVTDRTLDAIMDRLDRIEPGAAAGTAGRTGG